MIDVGLLVHVAKRKTHPKLTPLIHISDGQTTHHFFAYQ
jgi:hypothetical protein